MRPRLPTGLADRNKHRAAALLLTLYGLSAAVNGVILGVPGFGEGRPMFWLRVAAVPFVGSLCLAAGLWRRVSWVWWVVVLAGGAWLVATVVGLSILALGGFPWGELPPTSAALMWADAVLLSGVVVLLLWGGRPEKHPAAAA